MEYLALRAYFDLYGKFDGIDNYQFYDELKKHARLQSLSVKEYCFRSIGIPFDNIYSAEERYIKRTEVSKSIMGNKEINPKFKAHYCNPFFTKMPINESSDSDIIITVSNFMENTDLFALINRETNAVQPLSHLFLNLKFAKNKTNLDLQIASCIPTIVAFLKTAKINEKIETSYTIAGSLVIPKKINVEKTAREVCLHIGRRSQTMYHKHFYFIVANMLYYQLSDPSRSSAYLAMVDLSNVYDMTIAELIQYIGFSYVNQFEIWKHTGYFVYELPENNFQLIQPFEPYEQLIVPYNEFKEIYQSNRGDAVCMK